MRVSELQLHITLVVLGNVMLCEKNKSQKIQQHANLYIRFKTQPRCTICEVGAQTWKNYSEEQDLNTELDTVTSNRERKERVTRDTATSEETFSVHCIIVVYILLRSYKFFIHSTFNMSISITR